MEIMRQVQEIHELHGQPIDAIFCCVGGGGLAAGTVAYIKSIFPEVKVYGVEANDANAMAQALRAGHPVELKEVGLFADGAAVRIVGQETFRLCKGTPVRPGLDGIIEVTNDEICAAIRDVFVDTRTVLEPAGALGIAGLKKWVNDNGGCRGRREGAPQQGGVGVYVAVTSGANMNFDRLRFVAERASLGDEKEALIAAVIPEKPGRYVVAWGEGVGWVTSTLFLTLVFSTSSSTHGLPIQLTRRPPLIQLHAVVRCHLPAGRDRVFVPVWGPGES